MSEPQTQHKSESDSAQVSNLQQEIDSLKAHERSIRAELVELMQNQTEEACKQEMRPALYGKKVANDRGQSDSLEGHPPSSKSSSILEVLKEEFNKGYFSQILL